MASRYLTQNNISHMYSIEVNCSEYRYMSVRVSKNSALLYVLLIEIPIIASLADAHNQPSSGLLDMLVYSFNGIYNSVLFLDHP